MKIEQITQTHLDPSEVLQLQKFGVNFGDTEQVYRVQKHKLPEVEWYRDFRDNRLKDSERELLGEYHPEKVLPRPNLQEVLDKLPSRFCKREIDCDYLHHFDLNIKVYNEEYDHRYGIGYNSHLFTDDNLLLAATRLLRWLATYHPRITERS